MSARRERAGGRQPVLPKQTAPSTHSPTASPRQRRSTLVSAESALNDCVGAICLVEVTLHSLELQEVASPEQEVLKRALKAIWFVHDWIYELRPNDLEDEDTDRESEP